VLRSVQEAGLQEAFAQNIGSNLLVEYMFFICISFRNYKTVLQIKQHSLITF